MICPTLLTSVGTVQPSLQVAYMPGYALPVLTTEDQPNSGVILLKRLFLEQVPLHAVRQAHSG
ncbi:MULTISPECIES: hypothetical protein [unclassified Pseudofrankia]|uniref:hypothetical protein n=1 Tax=unclassified Pseudofrankia TaxID=2994372 RepID=UPI0008DB20AD|nr:MULTISPECIES: hypothetical protein [unclassified Pseudofrankia]MDT3444361.1 hypothetical protein [Pseudofrankia sp. BMG5.37]OHV55335.1 hypothetical protein BCD48_08620 [Pseudofrankia sp. BMG5.36]